MIPVSGVLCTRLITRRAVAYKIIAISITSTFMGIFFFQISHTAKPAMAVGTEVYKTDSGTVVARGRAHTDKERDAALDGPVRKLIEDEEGKRRAIEATESLSCLGSA